MDYKFRFKVWQDRAGSDNAELNIYADGTKVGDAIEISTSAVDYANADTVVVDITGLGTPAWPVSASTADVSLRFELNNEYYVDSSNDRNIYISGTIEYTDKRDGTNWKRLADGQDSTTAKNLQRYVTITDFDTETMMGGWQPESVTGDQIPSDFLDAAQAVKPSPSDSVIPWSTSAVGVPDIPVFGGDSGTTVVWKMYLSSGNPHYPHYFDAGGHHSLV